jgi:hypothetical protein
MYQKRAGITCRRSRVHVLLYPVQVFCIFMSATFDKVSVLSLLQLPGLCTGRWTYLIVKLNQAVMWQWPLAITYAAISDMSTDT